MKSKVLRLRFSLLAAICLSGNALGTGMADIAGTYSVTFQPFTSAGKLEGCSLVYKAVMLDFVYQNGAPVMAVGNITYYQKDKHPALSMKLGLANVLSGNETVQPPNYAFIRTKHGTTAGAKFEAYDSDVSGYRIFVYQLTREGVNVIKDIIDGENPTIGFNRTSNGVDATFSLDLSVEDITASNSGPQRKHSTEATEGFANCFSELAASLK